MNINCDSKLLDSTFFFFQLYLYIIIQTVCFYFLSSFFIYCLVKFYGCKSIEYNCIRKYIEITLPHPKKMDGERGGVVIKMSFTGRV